MSYALLSGMAGSSTNGTPAAEAVAAASLAASEAIHQTSTLGPSTLGRVGGTRVAERVVDALRAFIEGNGLTPGVKLPPERVFLEQLGVSRSSLREAVRVLSTLGIIDVRHGDGMYVGAGSDTGEAGALFDPSEADALRNLVETRLGVELAAVTAAAQRLSDEDIEKLEALIEE